MIVLLTSLIIFVIFSFTLSNFFSAGNLIAMMRSIAVLAILGLGMAIVVIGRGIDLSMVALMAVPRDIEGGHGQLAGRYGSSALDWWFKRIWRA